MTGLPGAGADAAPAPAERSAGIPVVEARAMTRILPGPVPVTLVKDIDLAIHPGELVAITGPSGSGKSSLLYLLGLLDAPTEGAVLIDGEDASSLDAEAQAHIRLARIGFVFQFHFLLPEFRVLDNVTVPMRKLGRLSLDAAEARGRQLLEDMDLGDHIRKRPDQLASALRLDHDVELGEPRRQRVRKLLGHARALRGAGPFTKHRPDAHGIGMERSRKGATMMRGIERAMTRLGAPVRAPLRPP